MRRLPVVYVPHGGGPWPFVEMGLDRREMDPLAAYLRNLRSIAASAKALLVISAHWEAAVPTVQTSANPSILYDYYGFPPESYQIQWPAPGSPALAARVRALLGEADISSGDDPERGFDHGTFIPFKLTYPNAELPTIQLSLKKGLNPSEHLAIGRALAPLRDEGVFIVGSGLSFHNLRAFRDPRMIPVSEAFDEWLAQAVEAEAGERDRRLIGWEAAPHARLVHPREEHLLPLMVVAGAAGEDRGKVGFRGRMMGMAIAAHQFGEGAV